MATVRQLADALELDDAERVELFAAAGHMVVTAGTAVPAPEPGPDDGLADAAGQLALQVRIRWQREEELRQIHDPFPLPVRWQPVPAELTDSWAEIRRVPAGAKAAAEPLDLTGRLDEIVAVYGRVESGRLVVLGQAGSGKTILTLRFVLDVLKSRAAADTVPVIFSLGSWNPTTTALRDWLTDQLQRDHPFLAAPGPDGSTLAAALVATDRVLPVLDGFDEIADGLHRAALEELNKTTLPLLLTSRVTEYRAAVEATDVLTAAAGVQLTDLTPADLAGYLPRTTRRTGEDGSVWQPVLTELRDHPGGTLAEVLTTPLMVGLARTIYSDTPDHDPAELLDAARFPTAPAVEEHLLGSFVPTVYRYQSENRRFDPERVQHWLGYLAHHLTQLGTHDLAWWQFGTAMRRPARVLVVALAVGLAIGLMDAVVEGIMLGDVTAHLVVFAAAIGSVAGLSFGTAHGLMASSRSMALQPARVRIRLRGWTTRTRRNAGPRMMIGFTAGLLAGIAYGLVRELLRALMLGLGQGIVVGIVDACVFGIVFGLGAGGVFAVMALCETPLDLKSVGSPADLLRANRTTVVVQVLLFGPAFAFIVTFGSWLLVWSLQQLPVGSVFGFGFVWSPLFGLVLGLVGGLGGGIGYALALTAWGQWVVFGRLWLPLTGRLPWAVPAFLDDAYRRGVLRRAGAVYQFRHARLQDHLTNTYPAT
jgi:hypothetical protein